MNYDHLAERYAEGIRKKFLIARMVPWGLLLQILVLVIKWFVLDVRKSNESVDRLLGPLVPNGIYYADMSKADYDSWKQLGV